MHIKKMITVLIVTAVVIASLTSCTASPQSLYEVTLNLESVMKIGFRHVSTEEFTNEEGYDKKIYYFEDENGVGFIVSSGVSKSSLGPHAPPPRCNYAEVLFELQKDVVLSAVQSDFPAEYVDKGIKIRVSCYSDLEKIPQVIENALMSIEPFPFSSSYEDSWNCVFDLPTIKVLSAEGEIIEHCYFRSEGNIQYPVVQEGILESMQKYYVKQMRRGFIEKEELPYDVLERFPADEINILYLNGEKIYEKNRRYFLIESMGGYQIRQIDIFDDDGILARYVKQMGGDHTVDGDKKTWTVNGDIWCAIKRSNAEEKKDYETLRTYYEITKNGEALKMPSEMPFEEFGEFFGFEIRIDQEEPAIYIVTPLQLEATNE